MAEEGQQRIRHNDRSQIDELDGALLGRRMRRTREGDEDVSECVSESRMFQHRAMPRRAKESSGLGPDVREHVEEIFERR